MCLIPCVSTCKYQHEGICVLHQAGKCGMVSDSGCIHYIPKGVNEYGPEKISSKHKDGTYNKQ